MAKTTASDVMAARVTITLDGDELELRPTPEAILTLSDAHDGLTPLVEKLQRMNVRAAIDVIIAGTGASAAAAKSLQRQILTTGMLKLVPKLIEYVTILANGGQRLDGDDADGEGQEGERP